MLLLILVLLILGAALAYWRLSPRLLSVSPPDGANVVPAGSSLRLEFSRPIRTEDILERLSTQPPIALEASWQGNTLFLTPDKSWPSGEVVDILLEPGAHADHWLGLPMRQETHWKFNVAQPRLVYLYPHDGAADIYGLDPYSGESQRWTSSSAGVESFSVAPGGTTIYYSVRADQGSSAIYHIDIRQEWSHSQERSPQDGENQLDSSELPNPILVLDCPPRFL